VKSHLTADNQMTPKPNLALNAEIESSGRAANPAITTARDPKHRDSRVSSGMVEASVQGLRSSELVRPYRSRSA
jgi:hypothetical protein